MAKTKVHPVEGKRMRKSNTRETLDRLEKEADYEKKLEKRRARSYDQILKEQKTYFNYYSLAMDALILGEIRSLIVSGAPGIGKSHLALHKLLEAAAVRRHEYEIAKGGGISAINLYMSGYRLRSGGTLLIDDADDVFDETSSLNILKALTDSGPERYISYRKEANVLLSEDIPKEYEFNGGVAFLTNVNLDEAIVLNRGAHVVHYDALLSRSLYLDLRIHDRKEIGVWVTYMTETNPILQREGITDKPTRDAIMKWIMDHSLTLRNLDLRTPTKVAQVYKTVKGKNWESAAVEFLCRD